MPPENVSLIRLERLTERRGRSRSQTYVDIKRGTFPPPIHVGERGLAVWPAHEVDAVLRAEIGGASAEELRTLVQELVTQRATLRPGAQVAA